VIALPLWMVAMMCCSGPLTWLAVRCVPWLYRQMFPRVTNIQQGPDGLVTYQTWGKSPFVRAGAEIHGTRRQSKATRGINDTGSRLTPTA